MAKLKGHAVIELRDVNTGEVERVEHDNLLTIGGQRLIEKAALIYGYSNTNAAFMPIIEKAMRGIYLFNEYLTESANNVSLPDVASAKLTGYAGDITSDGNDNKRGDFNSAESEALLNGYKFVWDFGTDDANGQIASLALTNNVAGFHGYNLDYNMAVKGSRTGTGGTQQTYKGLGLSLINFSSDPEEMRFIAAFENQVITTIRKTSATNIRLREYEIATKTLDLKESVLMSARLIKEENITISDTSAQSSYYPTFVDGGDGYFYGVSGYQNGSNYIIAISKIDKTSHAYTAASNVTIPNVTMPQIRDRSWTTNEYGSFTVRNGYIYAYTGTYSYNVARENGIIKIPISNPSAAAIVPNSTKTINHVIYGNPFSFYKYNGNIITSAVIIGSDDSIVERDTQAFPVGTPDTYGGYIGIWEDNGVVLATYHTSSQSIFIMPNLQTLLSINNLDTPVLKTASKTMKITYTLTEAS